MVVFKVPRIINLKHLELHPKTSILVNLWDDGQLNCAKQGSIVNKLKSKNAAIFLKIIRSSTLTRNLIRFIQEFLSSIVKNKNVTVEKSGSSMIPSIKPQ